MKNKTEKAIEVTPVQPTLNIETLIAQGIDKGLSVDVMERLLAMRTQLKEEFAKEQFIKALAAFQGECPIIEKKKKVSFGTTNYSYAPLEVIVDQVKELLAKYGFSYMFDTETNGKMKVICKVIHSAGHMETAKFDMEIDQSARMNVSQKYGAALTYAKRYAFCAAFGINVKDEDTDTAPVPQSPAKPQYTAPQSQQETPVQTTQSSNGAANPYMDKSTGWLKVEVSKLMNNGKAKKDYQALSKATREELIDTIMKA